MQLREVIEKIYAGAFYSMADYAALILPRKGLCEICGKPIKSDSDAETVAAIDELYGGSVS